MTNRAIPQHEIGNVLLETDNMSIPAGNNTKINTIAIKLPTKI